MTGSAGGGAATSGVDPQRFREVLGCYPTGVAIVSAIGPDGGPVGMVVGSFTSVSLSPPLVAFIASVTSNSYARLRGSETFCVSVLSASMESVCRRFAAHDPDKFAGQSWTPAPSGCPILDGAVAWIDCRVVDRYRAGDHDIVIGEVTSLDVGVTAGPLLFFQGGYGGFDPRALAAPFRPDLRQQLRIADLARPHLEALAARTGLECYAQSVAGEDLVITAACASHGRAARTHLGRRLPFAAPFGAVFAAFDPQLAALRAAVGAQIHGPSYVADESRLERVRRRGWSIGLLAVDHDAAWQEISLHGEVPASPAIQRRVSAGLRRIAEGYDPADDAIAGDSVGVRIITAPVRDAAGSVVQAIALFGFPPRVAGAAIQQWAAEVVATASAVSRDVAAAE